MPALTSEDIAKFHERGFAVVRDFFGGTRFLDEINAEMTALARIYAPNFDLDCAVDHIRAFSPHARHCFYNGLRSLAALNRLGSSDVLTKMSQQLGLRLPAVVRAYNIRMDMPDEPDFLFHWHQDIVYTLGSLNSVTYWIPFQRVDRAHGSAEVIPGSHRNGVYPVRYTRAEPPTRTKIMSPKDLQLVREPEQSGEVIEAERGDLVVFSTLILHRSIANHADKVRWTAQIRHADLAEPEFIAAGYPWGDMTNVFHAPYLLSRMSD